MRKHREIKPVFLVLLMTVMGSHAADLKTEGWLRLGYQHQERSDLAVGGKLHIESGAYRGISAGVSFYTSNGLQDRENIGIPFYDSRDDSYAILGEAYLRGVWGETEAVLGRQEIDIPYFDTDDVGMVPNTFEALQLLNHDLPDTTLFALVITRMAGVDAPHPEAFTKIGGHSAQVVGLLWEGIEGVSLQGWYARQKDEVDLTYLEGSYEGKQGDIAYSFGLQYTIQDHDDGSEADIYGVAGSVGYTSWGLNIAFSYNRTDSKNGGVADNFYGGGPFFTSCEHLTLADAGVDGKAQRIGLEWELESLGLNGVGFALSRLDLSGPETDTREIDYLLSYAPSETLSIDLIYSDADDNRVPENSFENTRLFLNYRF